MLLLLVRHALTEVTGETLTGRLPGFPLSEKGKAQAEAAAERLSGAPLKLIYSSPLERCMETAEIIASRHKAKVSPVESLAEIDYGGWAGKPLKTLYKTKGWQQLRARPADFRFPGGETIREAQTRGMNALEVLRAKHRNKAVLVCSHADMIRVVVAGYLGLGLDLYDRITVAPASITTLYLSDKTPRLVNLGDSGSYQEVFDRLNQPRDSQKKPK
jgi:probable phosphomutase (TIGR03848 family)